MNKQSKINNLQIFLRIFGVIQLVLFGFLFIAFALKMESLNRGGNLFWLNWDEVHGHVAPMLITIYLVWAVYFLIAAKNPLRYRSFLDFTMWANLFHGLVMIPMAFDDAMYHVKFLTDIPLCLVLALGIYLWRPDNLENSELVSR
jgi:hypothetical protein